MTRKLFKYTLVTILLMFCFVTQADWSQRNSRILTLELFKGVMVNIGSNVGSVFIADPNIVDYHLKAPGMLYLYAKKAGSTSLYVANKQGKVTFRYTVRVTQNVSELASIMKTILPDAHIKILSLGENIILRGTVKSAAQAQDAKILVEKYVGDPNKILTFLHVDAPTQVNLRVQVVEMSREAIRSIGINWSVNFTTPNTVFNINPILIPTEFAQASSNAVNLTGNLLNRGNFNLKSLIQLLEQSGLVTVLSEPNLTALSGEKASFLVGGEFPIPVPQGVSGAVTIIFKKFGVSLAFVPTILENGKINLQVRPEVSQLSEQGAVTLQGFVVPSLTTRQAQTTVELRSGQSFAIAGLLQNNATKFIQQFPGMGNIPILGRLFRSERFKRSETELVIIITPYIVQPGGNEAFLYPTDDINADITASFSRQSKIPNVGFILD
ncbi:MAG TPA: type II and III secretion system protein family protein [Gammaproteobacteria bacterium]|nr:type II and III secretion system protein family protein [Gammaproteobacteria bacterium]